MTPGVQRPCSRRKGRVPDTWLSICVVKHISIGECQRKVQGAHGGQRGTEAAHKRVGRDGEAGDV